MRKLIVRGDPGIRKGAVIEYDGEEYVCFGISRQGEFHGPDRVQLWCTIGTADEREAFERREFVPMRLRTDSVDAEDLTVRKAKGDPATA
ncbi:HAH_0734 family protein [Natronomonas sp.]|uniref:HAH_0734 family protein n=1 Tax=Natronomonas sp. TaxID=2184060 RepID=UPI002608FD80|nr:HAH_0734 family protein [Natronomonas sp.]